MGTSIDVKQRLLNVELEAPAGSRPQVPIPGRPNPVIIPQVPGTRTAQGTATFATTIPLRTAELNTFVEAGRVDVKIPNPPVLQPGTTGRTPAPVRPTQPAQPRRMSDLVKQWEPSKPGLDLQQLQQWGYDVVKPLFDELEKDAAVARADPDPLGTLDYQLSLQRSGKTKPLQDSYILELFAQVESLASRLEFDRNRGPLNPSQTALLQRLAGGPRH